MWIKTDTHAWVNAAHITRVYVSGTDVEAVLAGDTSSVTLRSGFADQAAADAWISDTLISKES